MLKSLRNLSDEEVVVFWSENPYAQDFCGEKEMQWGLPCDASELTHFRKRIGTAGAEKNHISNGYETGGEDRARGSENGAAAWGEVEAKFRAHGAEVAGGAEGAADQGRSGPGAQGGSAFEDDRRAGGAATGCGRSQGKPGPALGGNGKENPEPEALRERENLLIARTGGLLHEQRQGAQKV